MKKLIRLRRAHPVWYSLAAGIISVLLILGAGFGVGYVGVLVAPQADYYLLLMLQEAIGFVLVFCVVWASGFGDVLWQRGYGLFHGLQVGMYPLVLILLVATSGLTTCLQEELQPESWQRFLTFSCTMLLIGLAEELPFRGLICGTLLEAFGTSRAGIWKTVVVSGLIFGAAHAVNLLGAAPLGVFVQVVVSSVLGMIFAAIYLRSGNLWVTVLLHALMDFASLMTTGLFESGVSDSVGEAISGYGWINLLPVLTYGLPIFFLLRSKKLPEIQAMWTLNPGKEQV